MKIVNLPLWLLILLLTFSSSLGAAIFAFAEDPPLPSGPFEVVTQQITKNVKVLRIQDGDNACYLIIRQPASTGTVQPPPNVGGFSCLPQVGAPVEPAPEP